MADSNMITLPILLGMALSVGYSVHFVNSFRMHFRRTGARRDSVVKAVGETGWPILFTVITTIAPLISFLFSGIGPIRWVGGISATIVFSVYLYVIVFIPILMFFGKDRGVAGRERPVRDKTCEASFERVSVKALPEPSPFLGSVQTPKRGN